MKFWVGYGAMLTVIGSLFGLGARASGDPADMIWKARVLVLLGEKNIPAVQEQAKIFQAGAGAEALKTRQVEMLTERRPGGPLHKRYGHGEGFLVILIGKDGQEKLRSLKPVPLEKITKLIDSMPMRKDEIQSAQHQ